MDSSGTGVSEVFVRSYTRISRLVELRHSVGKVYMPAVCKIVVSFWETK
jgi:hypothetical protein